MLSGSQKCSNKSKEKRYCSAEMIATYSSLQSMLISAKCICQLLFFYIAVQIMSTGKMFSQSRTCYALVLRKCLREPFQAPGGCTRHKILGLFVFRCRPWHPNWFVLLFLQCATLHDCPFYETSPVSIRNTLFSTDYLVIVLAVYSKCLHVKACPNCTKIDAAHFLGSSATNLMTDE